MATRAGKKKALLIGINYTGQQSELSGCVNDIVAVAAACHALNVDEVRVLYDGAWVGSSTPISAIFGDRRPTRANMTAAFDWLVGGAAAGDRLLLHYSGHGGNLPALVAGSEADGRDETLVPVDYATAGEIRDDELRARLVERLKGTGASLRVILDCCHSGTGLDLRYNLAFGRDAKRNARAAAPARSHEQGAPKREDRLFAWGAGEHAFAVAAAELTAKKPQPGAADVVAISGCRDDQTSSDAHFGDLASGALTRFLLKALAWPILEAAAGHQNAWPLATDFLRDLRKGLKEGGFDQLPQLSSELAVTAETRFALV
jgi:hypothetical protein